MVRGGGTLVVDVLAITALQRTVSSDVVARVFGVFFALVLGAISLGALLVPILLAAFGLTSTLLIVGFTVPALTLLSYPKVRQVDKQAAGQLSVIEPRLAILQGLDIFAGATRATLERLALASVDEVVPARTVVVQEGDAADDFFVLVGGEAEVIAAGEAGVAKVLGTLSAPNYFGEIGLLAHRPRTATVQAITECALYRIKGTDFIEALTVSALSPTALGSAQQRLARTHPSLSLDFGPQARRNCGPTGHPPAGGVGYGDVAAGADVAGRVQRAQERARPGPPGVHRPEHAAGGAAGRPSRSRRGRRRR